MINEYSENVLVQESAGRLLQDELGWEVKFAYNQEILGKSGTFGRESYREVLLKRHFCEALKRLNPWMENYQIGEALETFEKRLSSSSLIAVNEEKYGFIRDGIKVAVKHGDGRREIRTVKVIDFENPGKNHFLAVKELKIHGDLYRRRTDIVGFVNGIPLLFVELKKNTVDIHDAFDCNYTDYLDTIPQLFYYNAFVVLSNGLTARVGTLGSSYEFFQEWKRLKEGEKGSVELETLLRGICRKENFLDILENFILYDRSGGKTVKILARNHQYLGVNEALMAYKDRRVREGKLGVFWHTQGSGKSYSMVFLTRKIRRKFKGSPTFVILTDRDDLNRQISDTFENCGVLEGNADSFIATSGGDLVERLKDNPSFIFTLIQKFNKSDCLPIFPDHDVVIISDEAHRSQYGVFADNMMRLLPTAARIGFTGTPLLSDDNITERTFGGYVSVYDFQRAVEDGATVPLFYESRGEKISEIKSPEINDKILDAIEMAELEPDQRERLEKEFSKEIQILTAEPRLRSIASDFVEHYSSKGECGKAMFICLDKITCVRMHDFVQNCWKHKISELESELARNMSPELERRIAWMKDTEMAVVISQEQNEIRTFEGWGLDIKYHREKMERRELDKEFKDALNPFRIVFVCAMWLTGFDVKCLSFLYLDKPMKAHTLMQAIARANRVNEGKSNGIIIDYVGIVKALKKALADYTMDSDGHSGNDPTRDKSELIARIADVAEKACSFLEDNGFAVESLVAATGFQKLSLLKEAANAICNPLEKRRTFSTYASELLRLVKYVDRNEVPVNYYAKTMAVCAIHGELQRKRRRFENVGLMVKINEIISEYVRIEDANASQDGEIRKFDISSINFDRLRQEFLKAKNRRLILKDLDEVIREKLDCLMKANPKRLNYYDWYSKIIEGYNNDLDRAAIERTFQELMELVDGLTQEEQRYVREGFKNDEELALYDLLFRNDLNKKEIEQIKEVSSMLLGKVKEMIARLDHWTDKQETRAAIDILIRDALYEGLPESYVNDFAAYRMSIYEYVYSRYGNMTSV